MEECGCCAVRSHGDTLTVFVTCADHIKEYLRYEGDGQWGPRPLRFSLSDYC